MKEINKDDLKIQTNDSLIQDDRICCLVCLRYGHTKDQCNKIIPNYQIENDGIVEIEIIQQNIYYPDEKE